MKLSIIIPTWNRSFLLKNIVNSLINQKLDFKFEIIVCDSHSPDGTSNKIRQIQALNSNLRIIQCDNNVAAKRNNGAKLAQGEWLLFLDDDVQIDGSLFLEKVINCTLNNSEAILSGLIKYPTSWVEKSNYYRYKNSRHFQIENNGLVLVEDWAYVSMCSLMRKDLFTRVGGYKETFISYGGEDHEFEFRTKNLGIKHFYMKNVLVFHHEGFTGIDNFYQKIKKSSSMYTFFLINYPDRLKLKMRILLGIAKFSNLFPLFLIKLLRYSIIKFLEKTDGLPNLYFYSFFKIFILCSLIEGLCESQDNNSFYN